MSSPGEVAFFTKIDLGREARENEPHVKLWRDDLPYYSSDWSATGKLIELMRRGVGGHAALAIEIGISDDPSYPDVEVKVYGPDLAPVEHVSYSVPESVAHVFLQVMGLDSQSQTGV